MFSATARSAGSSAASGSGATAGSIAVCSVAGRRLGGRRRLGRGRRHAVGDRRRLVGRCGDRRDGDRGGELGGSRLGRGRGHGGEVTLGQVAKRGGKDQRQRCARQDAVTWIGHRNISPSSGHAASKGRVHWLATGRAGRLQKVNASNETALIPISSTVSAPRSQSRMCTRFACMMPPIRSASCHLIPGKGLQTVSRNGGGKGSKGT